MKNAVTAEMIKLRRSRALLLAALAGVLPPAVKCLQSLSGSPGGTGWTGFLSSGQELTVFSMLIAVLLLSAHLFTMEYSHGTAGMIFTSQTGRAALYLAKLTALACVTGSLVLLGAASQLLFGALAVGEAPTAEVLTQFLSVTAWYVFAYVMVAAVAALPAVLTRRFMLSSVITLGYYILIFPFHTKNPYVCPFMTPAIVAAKIYGHAGYIFASNYDNLNTGVLPAGIFLLCLAVAAAGIGLIAYRRSDAVR